MLNRLYLFFCEPLRIIVFGHDWQPDRCKLNRPALTDRRLSLFICFRLLLLWITTISLFCVLSKDITTWRLEGGNSKIVVLLPATPTQLWWTEWQSNRKLRRLSIIVIIRSSWCFPVLFLPFSLKIMGLGWLRCCCCCLLRKRKAEGARWLKARDGIILVDGGLGMGARTWILGERLGLDGNIWDWERHGRGQMAHANEHLHLDTTRQAHGNMSRDQAGGRRKGIGKGSTVLRSTARQQQQPGDALPMWAGR